MTNAEKLALDPATAVGTQVIVTDGFQVAFAGESGCNGFWHPVGLANGKQSYRIGPNSLCIWITDKWEMTDVQDDTMYSSMDDVAFPWLITTWVAESGALPLPTTTNPVTQELQSPASAQGGVFVSGGTVDGIYSITGTDNSKAHYTLLGQAPDIGFSDIDWNGSQWVITNFPDGDPTYYSISDVATPDLVVANNVVFTIDFSHLTMPVAFGNLTVGQTGLGDLLVINDSATTPPNAAVDLVTGNANTSNAAIAVEMAGGVSTKQQIINAIVAASGGKITDLGSLKISVAPIDHNLEPYSFTSMTGSGITTVNNGWKNSSDDTAAPITTTNVTQGELDAGVTVSGAGTTSANDKYPISGSNLGKEKYTGLAHALDLQWNGTAWKINNANPTGATNSAIPSGSAFNDSATVARNNVAAEGNWIQSEIVVVNSSTGNFFFFNFFFAFLFTFSLTITNSIATVKEVEIKGTLSNDTGSFFTDLPNSTDFTLKLQFNDGIDWNPDLLIGDYFSNLPLTLDFGDYHFETNETRVTVIADPTDRNCQFIFWSGEAFTQTLKDGRKFTVDEYGIYIQFNTHDMGLVPDDSLSRVREYNIFDPRSTERMYVVDSKYQNGESGGNRLLSNEVDGVNSFTINEVPNIPEPKPILLAFLPVLWLSNRRKL